MKNRLGGFRKFFVVLIIVGVAAAVPLNVNQSAVLQAALYAFVLGNAVEHVAGGKISEKVVGMAGSIRRRIAATDDGEEPEVR